MCRTHHGLLYRCARSIGAGPTRGLWHLRAPGFVLQAGLQRMAHPRHHPGDLPVSKAGRELDGPLFLGIDTHALSVPACASALEVLAANGVEVMLAEGDEYTPTPVISHAILTYNRGRKTGLADGIVITPRTIRRMMAASNTIRPMADRRTMSSPIGLRRRRMRCSKPG
jgi:hypothetical protein